MSYLVYGSSNFGRKEGNAVAELLNSFDILRFLVRYSVIRFLIIRVNFSPDLLNLSGSTTRGAGFMNNSYNSLLKIFPCYVDNKIKI